MSQDKAAAASLGGVNGDATVPIKSGDLATLARPEAGSRIDLMFEVGIAIHCPLCGVLVEACTRHECSRLEEDAIERARRLAK